MFDYTSPMARASGASVPGFDYVRSKRGIHEYRLRSNGLRCLIYPRSDVPVVAVMVTYHIGSRHEKPGTTGSTHILEHMMFKGSKHFDQKKGRGFGAVIETTGAQANATTWLDRTNYYEILPVENLKDALRIEADRMKNLLLREADLASEMIVVRNEYERGRNDPHRILSSKLWETAFTLHPYHYDTIGLKDDIESVTVQKLRTFYESHYWPNNATISIIGDISVPSALREILAVFGNIRAGMEPASRITPEPPQNKERVVSLVRQGAVRAVGIGYKTPDARHGDTAALGILATLLADGKSSLLQRALVDSALSTSVSVFPSRFLDPGLLEFTISLSGKTSHKRALGVFNRVVSNVTTGRIERPDIIRAKAYAVARILGYSTSISGFMQILNESIASGDWATSRTFAAELDAVSMSDVVRVAQMYLVQEGRTVVDLKTV